MHGLSFYMDTERWMPEIRRGIGRYLEDLEVVLKFEHLQPLVKYNEPSVLSW